MMMEWVDLKGLARDQAARNEFLTLMEAYKSNPEKWNRVYTYDTYNRDWFYLDGQRRIPFVKRK